MSGREGSLVGLPSVREPDPAPRVPSEAILALAGSLAALAAGSGRTIEARDAALTLAAIVDDAAAALLDRVRLELAEALADTALIADLTSRPDRAAMLEAIAAALSRHADTWHRATDSRGLST